MAPRLRNRLLIALVVGCTAGWYCHARLRENPTELAHDFTYPLNAARHVIAGRSPYREMKPGGPGSFPAQGYFFYPLPTALFAIPFTRFDVYFAGAAFFGVSSALLAFALTEAGYWRLLLLTVAPYTVAAWSVQWSPLMAAVALLPALGWLGLAKPNLGLAAFAYRPRWSTAVVVMVLCVASLLVQPNWPREWMDITRLAPSHSRPLMWPLGFLILPALLRWRTPEARLLLVLALMPVSVWLYDHLLLALVAKTLRQLATMAIASWAGLLFILAFLPLDFTDHVAPIQRLVVLSLYIPAVVVVLRNPNHGVIPSWLEHLTSGLPAWLRGSRAPLHTVASE